ncbi:MAG: nucleotidyltransferase family protein [Singulisphaera sp.]
MAPGDVSVRPEPRFFAVIPAAGRSTRMGQPKLLLPWRGQTVIEHVLQAWRASQVSNIIVVVHSTDVALAEASRRAGATVVAPDVPPPEMKASVQAALAWLRENESPSSTDAWLVAPADLPRLSPELIDAVIAAHLPELPRIIVPACAGRRGHPVLFPWDLSKEVDRLAPDEGLNALGQRQAVFEIPWDDADAQADLDSPADYDRLREKYGH